MRYNSSSTLKPPRSRLFNYAALGAGSLGAGYFIGRYYNKSKETKGTSSATLQVVSVDASTAPLSTLDSPVYANEEQFKQGLSKIIDIVGKDHALFDPEVLSSHNDSFYSTHHPPQPDKQKPNVVITPTSTEQVSQIMKIAHEYRLPVVASSGLTSLEGQNIHTRGPFSISISILLFNQV